MGGLARVKSIVLTACIVMALYCAAGVVSVLLGTEVFASDAPAKDKKRPAKHIINIPTVDIAGVALPDDAKRHVILASGTKGADWQHPHMLLMPDGKTIFAVWTAGHGGPCGPMKKSGDGGLTWSEQLDVPKNWSSVRNCPTIHRLVDPKGVARLLVFAVAGNRSFSRSISKDSGRTWSPMKSAGFSGVVPPMTVLPVESGKKFMTWTHSRTVLQCESTDGGLTWSKQRRVIDTSDFPGAVPCEPEVVRSPDGKQLLMLMRENSRRYHSLYAVSNDEGRTWLKARELPAALTGDRHTAVYAKDGRLVVMFRNRRPVPRDQSNEIKAGIPVFTGPITAWVGRYSDIVEGREGQYRVSLFPSHPGSNGYGKLERLPDGTIIAINYCVYRAGEKKSVVFTRYKMDELDKRLARK